MTNIIRSFKLPTRLLIHAGVVMAAFMIMGGFSIARAETLSRQLELGMSGSDVSSLQIFLAADSSIYPQGLITGYFGFLTKAAVSNFQSRNGIATVGRVGPVTLAAINAQMNGNMADKYAPTISSLSVNVSNTSAAFSWNTSENSAAIIYYSTSPLAMTEANANSGVTVSGTSLLVHTDLRTSHAATLTGLFPNATYYYVVYVRDGSGNESVTWPSTFHTNQ